MVVWLDDTGRHDVDQVGAKAAWLGEIYDSGQNVPAGFVVESGLKQFLEENGIERKVRRLLRREYGQDMEGKKRVSQRIDQLITDGEFPSSLRDTIEEAYENIHVSQGIRDAGGRAVDLIDSQRGTGPVAVRASVDEKRSSLISGEIGINTIDEVITSIKTVWARSLSPVAVELGEDVDAMIEGVPVLVQNLVEAEASLSVFVEEHEEGIVRVEGYPGIGTLLREGEVVPDVWMVDRSEGKILSRSIADKRKVVRKDPQNGRFGDRPVPSHKRTQPCITNDQLASVVNMALSAQRSINESARVGIALRGGAKFVTSVGEMPLDIVVGEEGMSTKQVRCSGTVSSEISGENTLLVGDDLTVDAVLDDSVEGLVLKRDSLSSRTVTAAVMSGKPVLIGNKEIFTSAQSQSYAEIDFGEHSIVRDDEERGQSDDSHRERVTATDVVVMDEKEGSFIDTMLSSAEEDTRYVSPACDGKIRTRGGEETDNDWLLVSEFGMVFDAAGDATAVEMVVFDVMELVSDQGSAAVRSLFERIPDLIDDDFGVYFGEADEDLCEAAIRAGASVVMAPKEIHAELERTVERCERRVLLEGVRRLL